MWILPSRARNAPRSGFDRFPSPNAALSRAECSVRSEVRAETQVFPSSGTPLLGLKESRPTARCVVFCAALARAYKSQIVSFPERLRPERYLSLSGSVVHSASWSWRTARRTSPTCAVSTVSGVRTRALSRWPRTAGRSRPSIPQSSERRAITVQTLCSQHASSRPALCAVQGFVLRP